MVWYMVWHGIVYGMAWYGMIWYGMIWYSMIWYGIWYGMIWYDMVWFGVGWYGHDHDLMLNSPQTAWLVTGFVL